MATTGAAKGTLIIIEAGDGSGKETQTHLLAERLERDGRRVKLVAFPDYESDSSALVKMYLRGDFGSDADAVNPYAASIFFAADRYASYMTKWREEYEQGTIIIADRYTTSNMVHQSVKIKDRAKRDEFLAWLYELEFRRLKLPAPTRVYFLDMNPQVSLRLLEERACAKGVAKDIHEQDADYLRRTYETYVELAKYYGWRCIRSSDGEQPLPREEILEALYQDVLQVLPKHD